MDVKDKRFLVIGTGKSGVSAAGLLKSRQLAVRLYDGSKHLDRQVFYQKNPELKDVELLIGDLPKEEMQKTDILVLSPGVPVDLPIVTAMREAGVSVWGEIELAYQFAKGRILAITGTNGKTTTTALLGEIMKNCYSDVQVVGNIGIPYTSVAGETADSTVTVAEISSFQLETIHTFAPEVTAILNITPDHLDRHRTMANYIAAKESITQNQGSGQLCVLNYEDAVLREFGQALKTRVP